MKSPTSFGLSIWDIQVRFQQKCKQYLSAPLSIIDEIHNITMQNGWRLGNDYCCIVAGLWFMAWQGENLYIHL